MEYQVAVITGAGSGIGRQLALDLSAMGTAIAAVDYRADGLKKLDDDIKARQGRKGLRAIPARLAQSAQSARPVCIPSRSAIRPIAVRGCRIA